MQMEKISTEEQLNLILLNSEEWDFNNNLTENDIANQVLMLELELEDQIKYLKNQSEVTTSTDGLIRQINVKVGNVISPNFTLAIINVKEKKKNYILNLYIPFDANEIVTKGMDVDIELFSVDENLYGWLKGNVTYASSYISDSEGLLNDLENQTLIEFIESKGIVYKVIVELMVDPDTFSGFAWSNKKGPPAIIQPGQLGIGYVNVKVKAPIDFVIPIFNNLF
jgi:HlyD family secretion protein